MSRTYQIGDKIGPYNAILLERLENRKGRFLCPFCKEKEFIAYISNVSKGAKKSCGCQSKHYHPGDKVGPYGIKLIKYTYKDKNNKWHGLFKCPRCDDDFESMISNISKGNTASCGCLRDDDFYKKIHEHNYKDLAGQRSGDWTFLHRTDRQSKNGTWYWYCECDNGHSKEILSSNFEKTTLCQECHSNSKGEQKVKSILDSLKINYLSQYAFEDCKNINALYFDFYLPDNNCCIEYDGIQHFEKTHFSHDSFEIRQERDEMKNQYCKRNGITLIRIPYWDFDKVNEEYLLEKISG